MRYNPNDVCAAFVMEQTMEPQKVKILQEPARNGLYFVKFKATLQNFNVFNRNGRNYFLEPMRESWADPHMVELIRRGDAMGECGHPITENPKRIVTVDPGRACHRITGYEFIGNRIDGYIETLNDRMYGEQFTGHILQGCSAAFSLRALAPLTKIDARRVEVRGKSYIIAVDRVILPSHDVAYQLDDPVTLVDGRSATTEGALPSLGYTDEDVNIAIPVTESLTNFYLEESQDLKMIINQFDLDAGSARIDSTGKNVFVNEGISVDGIKRTCIVSMEGYVRNQVSDILTKLGGR